MALTDGFRTPASMRLMYAYDTPGPANARWERPRSRRSRRSRWPIVSDNGLPLARCIPGIFTGAPGPVKLAGRKIAVRQQKETRGDLVGREEVTMSRIMRIALAVVAALGVAAANGELIWPK
jgi:hypothetical protein